MPKSSIKEKPDFDETVHHFPSYELYQQYFDKDVQIPIDFANQLNSKKNMSKTNLKVLSREIVYKKNIDIDRIQQYIRTPDDIIVLCIVGNESERAKFKAFKFKSPVETEKFIEKLTIRQKEIRSMSQSQQDDNISTGTSVKSRNQTLTKLSENDFSTFGRRKSKMDANNVYGADEEAKFSGDEDNFDNKYKKDDRKNNDRKDDKKYSDKNYNDYGNEYNDEFDDFDRDLNEDYQGYTLNKKYKDDDNKDVFMPQIMPSKPTEVSYAGRNMNDWKNGPVLLNEACDMSKVRAPEFGKFPSKLPVNISDDLNSQKLQYTGDARIYENGIEFINKNTNDVLFSAPYSEIKNIHEFGNQPTNLLLFRNDQSRNISQMVLLNFDSRSGTRNVSNILKNKDVEFYQYEIPKENAVSVSRNNFTESSNDNFEQMKPVKDTPGQYSGRTSSFSGKDSQFDTISIKRSVSRKRVEQFNTEDLKKMPDGGPWDYNLVFLKEDPIEGTIADDEGSVYMFVAHKLRN